MTAVGSEDGQVSHPWVEEDKLDCELCTNDQHCNQTITLNIDLMNVSCYSMFQYFTFFFLPPFQIKTGDSSALGGPHFHTTDSTRMIGIPFEFPSVCSAMTFFQTRKNINYKTQVIGFAPENRDVLIPSDGRKIFINLLDQNFSLS